MVYPTQAVFRTLSSTSPFYLLNQRGRVLTKTAVANMAHRYTTSQNQGDQPPSPRKQQTSPIAEAFHDSIKALHELPNKDHQVFQDARHWERISSYQVEPAFFSYDQLGKDIALEDPDTIRQILAKVMSTGLARQGDLLTIAITRSCCEFYNTLNQVGKTTFLRILAQEYGVSLDTTRDAARALVDPAKNTPVIGRQRLALEHQLRMALTPAYDVFFHHASKFPGGIKFIIDLRKLLLQLVAQDRDNYPMVALNRYLRGKLQSWLVGILKLERITWNSPAATLEKLINYEAVHAITGWDDLKKRVGPGRRCYGFFHHTMPLEPLVFVQVALVNAIPGSIQSILRDPNPQAVTADSAKCAIFYSITSQPGLSGVELGSFLIKRVVRELQMTHPSLDVFCTLSPIPGFRTWLTKMFDNVNALDPEALTVYEATDGEARPPSSPAILNSILQDPRWVTPAERASLATLATELGWSGRWTDALQKLLNLPDWPKNIKVCSLLKPILLRLCTNYLLHQKRGRFALDPVTNFHLRNGACIHRINWLGDLSAKGLDQSCGMMVNYNYILKDVERNNYCYTCDGTIAQVLENPASEQGLPSYL
ncbi:hypothetical protein IWQ61_010192 [Dispira simplex]|nr:hypothetical protein IWQ61_010192 [Dispira simplex]